jgi:hypothetical protein
MMTYMTAFMAGSQILDRIIFLIAIFMVNYADITMLASTEVSDYFTAEFT